MFTEDAEWADHAFCVRAKGHSGVEQHFSIWVGSVPNFTMNLTRCWEVPEGVVAMYDGKGTMTKDLPDLKAQGTPFEFQGFLFIQFEGSLISSIDETYTRAYQETPNLDSYPVKS